MPNYLTPGVYVEEVPSTTKPIEGVGTSVAAFVGLAPGGPINTPMRLSNWSQFERIFSDTSEPDNGPFMDNAYLAHSVYGFFQNGGQLCWVVRVGKESSEKAQAALPAATDRSLETFRATAVKGIEGPVKMNLSEEEGGKAGETTYKLVIDTESGDHEEFEGLTMKKGRTNLATKVNAQSKIVKIEDTGASLPEAQRTPAAGEYTLSPPIVEPASLTPSDFEGDVARRVGMGGLAAVDEVTMLSMPDIMTLGNGANGSSKQMIDLQNKMIAHCENAGDRMAILDAPADLIPQEVLDWRMETAGYDSKYAALYYPWVEIMNPLTNKPLMVPASGHLAGIWCRTDASRGVHKAPANEVILGVNGLGFQVTHAEQGALNQNGVNCIRSFPGRGIRVWGARTLSSDPEWRYINVRRLFNFVAESIMEGTQWSVFEPNDERLWMRLRIAASNFLERVWRDGALFGVSPDQAFYVKCDSETNPPEVIDAGQVICEIGIAPVKPAEFIVFRLSQFSAAGTGEISG